MLDTEVEVCRYTQMQCIQPKSRYSGYRESCFRPVRLQIQWIQPVSGRVPDTVDTYLTSRVIKPKPKNIYVYIQAGDSDDDSAA